MLITSTKNPRIKDLIRLNNRRHRDALQHTIVEGVREVHRALNAGIRPTEAYVCKELIQGTEAQEALESLEKLAQARQLRLIEVTPEVFARIAYRGESGGLLLVIPYLPATLDALPLSSTPFLIVVEGVEKPGNLGAILRTADAAGVDGLILCGEGTDLHNPNVVRASLGTLFSVPVAQTTTEAAIVWLQARNMAIVAATPDAVTRYTDVDLTGPVAIVTGSEARGLSSAWLQAATHVVTIPMYGIADSLNLATSTAILLYEVVRQRERSGQSSG
jgi:TrmH family RNA methyltransferase